MNSTDFCIKQIKKQNSPYIDRDFSKAIEVNMDYILNYLSNQCNSDITLPIHIVYFPNGFNTTINCQIEYNPNADFDYFTSKCMYTDGTLIFEQDAMCDLFNRLVNISTYDNRCKQPDFSKNFTIKYTIGNFVVIHEYKDRWSEVNDPWMNERLTVMLPIKYEYEEQT